MKKQEEIKETGESGKPKFFLPFRRVLIYDLLLALAAGILIFVCIFILSLERLSAQNCDHLFETIDAVKSRMENENFQNEFIRQAYRQRMDFVMYEYEALRRQKDELDEADYADMLSPYSNLAAALADADGNIIQATNIYEKSSFLKTFDHSSETAVFDVVQVNGPTDASKLSYREQCCRKINDNLWIFFQIRYDDDFQEFADWFDFSDVINNKSSENTRVVLTDSEDYVIMSLNNVRTGAPLFSASSIFDRTLMDNDHDVEEKIVFEGNRFHLATGTEIESAGLKVWCIQNLSVPLESAVKRTILLVFIMLAVMILQSAYIYYNRQYQYAGLQDSSYSASTVRYKTMIVGLLGVVVVGALSYYVDTLISISSMVLDADDYITQISWAIDDSKRSEQIFMDTWKFINLENTSILSEYLVLHPDSLNAEEFRNIASIFELEYMMLFDKEGKEQFSSNSYTGFTLDNIEGVSFNDMIKGRMFQASDVIDSQWGYESVQVVAYQMLDLESMESQGILVPVYDSDNLLTAMKNSGVSYIISEEVSNGNNAVFVVDSETRKFIYAPDKDMIGENVIDCGFSESILIPYYTGYLQFSEREYYVTSRSSGKELIYIGSEYYSVFFGRWIITIAMALLGVIQFSILLFLMRRDRGKTETVYCEKGKQPVIHPQLLDQFYSEDKNEDYTLFAMKHSNGFDSLEKLWEEAIPETKVTIILRIILYVAALVILIYYFTSERAFSIISYSLNMDRGGGFNIFAATSILIIIIFGLIAVSIICLLLDLLSLIMKSRGETICRLIKSSVELFSILLIFYISLARLGFDIRTLVASAGLMALVIGMGARDLITDILAGLFIIFEGDFQVGDIVEVNGFMGMVSEIGIRTTKIVSWTKNVKIVNNRSLSSVMNLTNRNSFAMISFKVPNSVKLTLLADTLNRELKEVRKKYPQMLSDPVFKGVHALNPGSMECRVSVEVAERYRGETEDVLNWEVKEILERNGIPLS